MVRGDHHQALADHDADEADGADGLRLPRPLPLPRRGDPQGEEEGHGDGGEGEGVPWTQRWGIDSLGLCAGGGGSTARSAKSGAKVV